MKPKPDLCTCTFGARIILQHLQSLQDEIEGVKLALDIEAVHRMRVATRRLRAALPLFQECFPPKKVKQWSKRFRTLTRSLGAARDRDVQIELLEKIRHELADPRSVAGLRRLILRLNQHRTAMQSDVILSVSSYQESGIGDSMQKTLLSFIPDCGTNFPYTYALYQISAYSITQGLDTLMDHEKYIYDPANIEELHQMRISAKRLRYIMEVFAPIYGDSLKSQIQVIKSFQDTLGDIHDCDVWIDYLPVFIGEERQRIIDYCGHSGPIYRYLPGIQSFRENRQERREKLYRSFLDNWKMVQAESLWEQLRNKINLPFVNVNDIYPPPVFNPLNPSSPEEP